jgi:hypothetical protein
MLIRVVGLEGSGIIASVHIVSRLKGYERRVCYCAFRGTYTTPGLREVVHAVFLEADNVLERRAGWSGDRNAVVLVEVVWQSMDLMGLMAFGCRASFLPGSLGHNFCRAVKWVLHWQSH